MSTFPTACGGYGIPGPPGPPGAPLAATGAALFLVSPLENIPQAPPAVLSNMGVEYEYGSVDTTISPVSVVATEPGLYLVEASVVWEVDPLEVPEGTYRAMTLTVKGETHTLSARSVPGAATTLDFSRVTAFTAFGSAGMIAVTHSSANLQTVTSARISLTMLSEIEGPS
jgi:hypothetical protein